MKNLVGFLCMFILSGIIGGCANEQVTNIEDVSTEQQYSAPSSSLSTSDCSVYQLDDDDYIDINNVGIRHNQVMADLEATGNMFFSPCEESSIILLEQTIEEIIANNTSLQSTFGFHEPLELINPEFLYEQMDICNIVYKTELRDNLLSIVDANVEIMVESGHFANHEIQFLKDFVSDLLSDLDNEKPELSGYYEYIINNPSLFVKDGDFSLAILRVFDYSSCYWLYEYDSESAQLRIAPWLIGVAVTDLVGAWSGGMVNIIQNNGETGDEFLQDMGRGALSASSGGFGAFVNLL